MDHNFQARSQDFAYRYQYEQKHIYLDFLENHELIRKYELISISQGGI